MPSTWLCLTLRLPLGSGSSPERRGGGRSVCFPFDVDSGEVEIAADWASAFAGGEDGGSEEFAEYGAAPAEIQPVGSVGCYAVPDFGDVGRPGESGKRVNLCGGGQGVFDLGQSSAEFAGAGAQLGEGDGAVSEGGREVGEALADGGGFGV